MKKAYNEMYLDDSMRNLGEMLDYAVNGCGMEMDSYWELFLASGLAEETEAGNPAIICGMSGTELVREVLTKVNYFLDYPETQIEYQYSSEYWCGWIIAYYQWETGRTFREINAFLPMKEICEMYLVYHEMAEQRFVEDVEAMFAERDRTSNLQLLRRMRGYSQRMLAQKAGVNLRTLQQYEIRAKDINKASVSSLYAISQVLDCSITELME